MAIAAGTAPEGNGEPFNGVSAPVLPMRNAESVLSELFFTLVNLFGQLAIR
jgi:hypothetical protein